MSFPARFNGGTCSECAGAIRKGDLIQDDGGAVRTYSHVECPDPFPEDDDFDDSDPLAVKPGETLCTRCFLIHKGECF